MRRVRIGLLAVGVLVIGGGAYYLGSQQSTTKIESVGGSRTTTTTTQIAAVVATDSAPTAVERPPLIIHLTASLDLDEALRGAARELMGRGPDPGDYPVFEDAYHAQETQAQQAVYDGAPTVEQPASPDAAAQAFIRQHHAQEVEQYAYLQEMNVVNGMIQNPPPGGRSTTTTSRYCSSFGTTTTTAPYSSRRYGC